MSESENAEMPAAIYPPMPVSEVNEFNFVQVSLTCFEVEFDASPDLVLQIERILEQAYLRYRIDPQKLFVSPVTLRWLAQNFRSRHMRFSEGMWVLNQTTGRMVGILLSREDKPLSDSCIRISED